MSVSINEISENAKLARDLALTGNYETSGVYYQGVIQQINRLLSTIVDTSRKAKWQLVQHQIADEYDKVNAAARAIQLFKADVPMEKVLGNIYIYVYLI